MERKFDLDVETILNKEFNIDFKGYSPADVDLFLDKVIHDYQCYDEVIATMGEKMESMDRSNASLKARIIELEGKQKAIDQNDPVSTNQVDILKRLAKLEAEVYNTKVQ